MELVKAHAYGNDFLIVTVSDLAATPESPAAVARRLCDRHQGFGADGLLAVDDAGETPRMTLLNADGSPSELSGNGLRCVAAWLAERNGSGAGPAVSIGTDAGDKHLTLLNREGMRFTFRAAMGPPEHVREEQLDVHGAQVSVVTLRVGNPQCVVLGPATEERLRTIAAALAVHPRFPHGTNVELAEVLSPNRIRILIWERGVGPTTSSGTGTCAAAVAASAYGGAARVLEVDAPGGSQTVEWLADGLWLTGWAELIGRLHWWR